MEWFVQQKQGDRSYQEDRFHVLSIDTHTKLFAIYDGHGNASISQALAHESKGLLDLLKTFHVKNKRFPTGQKEATDLFQTMDQDLYQRVLNKDGGSTALVVAVQSNDQNSGAQVYLWNVGDSRAVVYNGSMQVVLQTRDHKPTLPKERARVVLKGGNISTKSSDARVTSDYTSFGYATSRAMGDFELKKNFSIVKKGSDVDHDGVLSCTPDVFHVDGTQKCIQWIIMGSDGLWDVLQPEEMVDYCHGSAKQATLSIMKEATKERNTSDNITVLVIKIPFFNMKNDNNESLGHENNPCMKRLAHVQTTLKSLKYLNQ